MNAGLIYMVGPSGVGKDSLLAWLSHRPQQNFATPLHIARRSITRPKDGGTENHEALTEQAFSTLEAAGGFAMCWDANGLRYGIRRSELAALDQGHWVVVNGSRAYVPTLRRDWPGASVLHIQAPADVVRARLQARGREAGAALEARIQRSQALSAARVAGDMELLNEGSLDESGQKLLTLLVARARAGEDEALRPELE